MLPRIMDNQLKLGRNLKYRETGLRRGFYSYDLCIARENITGSGYEVYDYQIRTVTTARHINHIIKYLKRNNISMFEYKINNNNLLYNEQDFMDHCPTPYF
jgi:hypothetical protein